jgi:hypothetical protein
MKKPRQPWPKYSATQPSAAQSCSVITSTNVDDKPEDRRLASALLDSTWPGAVHHVVDFNIHAQYILSKDNSRQKQHPVYEVYTFVKQKNLSCVVVVVVHL